MESGYDCGEKLVGIVSVRAGGLLGKIAIQREPVDYQRLLRTCAEDDELVQRIGIRD